MYRSRSIIFNTYFVNIIKMLLFIYDLFSCLFKCICHFMSITDTYTNTDNKNTNNDTSVFIVQSIKLTDFLWLMDCINGNKRRPLIKALHYWSNLGINPTTVYYNGWTLLTIAICNTNIDMIDILVDYGANVSMQMENGLYPIEYSTNYNVMKHLVSKNANINSYNKYGLTPLMMAVISGNPEQVISLLSCGADINLKSISYDKKTCVNFAHEYNKEEILFILNNHQYFHKESF